MKFLLALAVLGCTRHTPMIEDKMKEQAQNFCSCHEGFAFGVFLEEYRMYKVQCKDDSRKVLIFGQKIKPCEAKK